MTVTIADPVPPAARLIEGVLREDESPAVGNAVRVIVPEKPLVLARLTSEVEGIPAEAVIAGWPVEMVKSTTFTVTVIE